MKEKALKNIHLIDKNYTLENTLHDTQKMMASIVAQNKLLQDQLAALNPSSSVEATILSDIQALQSQQQTTGVLPAFAGADPDESMANDSLPMPIRGGGVLPWDTDASDGNTGSPCGESHSHSTLFAIHFVDNSMLTQECTDYLHSDGLPPFLPKSNAMAIFNKEGSKKHWRHVNVPSPGLGPQLGHDTHSTLLGMPQGTNLSPSSFNLISKEIPSINFSSSAYQSFAESTYGSSKLELGSKEAP